MRFVKWALVVLGLAGLCAAWLTAQTGPKDVEWRHYAADLAGTHYSPLDQINAGNFNRLQVAWRFKTDNLGQIGRAHV